jgi:hypothetical protein
LRTRDRALETGRARLKIGDELAGLGRDQSREALAGLLAAEPVSDAWAALLPGQQRAAVDTLMEAVLHPVGRGARVFDPAVVLPEGTGIIWRTGPGDQEHQQAA